eukprot:11391128-Alexandrium_andersonii.AAC.1
MKKENIYLPPSSIKRLHRGARYGDIMHWTLLTCEDREDQDEVIKRMKGQSLMLGVRGWGAKNIARFQREAG